MSESLLNKYRELSKMDALLNEDEPGHSDPVIAHAHWVPGNPPIHQSVKDLLIFIKMFEPIMVEKDVEPEDDRLVSTYHWVLKNYQTIIKSDVHLFRLQDDLAGMLVKSDADVKYEPCPFKIIFIDGEHQLSRRLKSYGLFVIDAKDQAIKDQEVLIVVGTLKVLSKADNEFVSLPFCVIFGEETFYHSQGDLRDLVDCEEVYTLPQKFVCSVLNFLNHKDIEVIDKQYSDKDVEKQIKKGRFPRRLDRYIRVTGKTKIYIENLKNRFGGQIDWNHAWWVRGHFRRYQSDRYINKKGEVSWIMPQIRGKGPIREKEYFLKENEGGKK